MGYYGMLEKNSNNRWGGGGGGVEDISVSLKILCPQPPVRSFSGIAQYIRYLAIASKQ